MKYNLITSFGFALEGLWRVLKRERNFKIHCCLALMIFILGLILGFTASKWLIYLLIVALVLTTEVFNSAIEGVCDLLRDKLKLEYHETRNIRNIAAGAVFLNAVFAIIIGLVLIFA